MQQARSINREIFSAAQESCFDERYFELFSRFDAVLDVFAYQPILLGCAIEEIQMELYRRYMAQLFNRLAACRRFAQIRIPTNTNAEESGLDPQDYIRRMDRAYDVDYEAVHAACSRAMERFSGASRVVIHTGGACDLHLDLTGRAWGMIGLISQLGYVAANAIVGYLADHVFAPALREGGILYGNIGRIIGTGAGRGAALLIILGGICMCVLAPCIYRSCSIRSLEEARICVQTETR